MSHKLHPTTQLSCLKEGWAHSELATALQPNPWLSSFQFIQTNIWPQCASTNRTGHTSESLHLRWQKYYRNSCTFILSVSNSQDNQSPDWLHCNLNTDLINCQCLSHLSQEWMILKICTFIYLSSRKCQKISSKLRKHTSKHTCTQGNWYLFSHGSEQLQTEIRNLVISICTSQWK